MPTAKYNRQLRKMPFYSAGDPNRRSNVGAGKHGYAQAERIFRLPENRLFVIWGDKIINNLDIETCLQQWRRQAKE